MSVLSLVPAIVWRGLASLAIIFGVVAYLENRGAEKAIRKVEKANAQGVYVARQGGSGTRNPAARGVRDPNTVDD